MGSAENETRRHILLVGKYLGMFSSELIKRGSEHDASKLEEPELSIFEEFTPKLAGCTYGSDEYKAMLKEMKPALDHHYANNSHHPEYADGELLGERVAGDRMNSMDLFSLVEMFCDWMAASQRHVDGDIMKSIDINEKRFDMDGQVAMMMRNTVCRLGGRDG